MPLEEYAVHTLHTARKSTDRIDSNGFQTDLDSDSKPLSLSLSGFRTVRQASSWSMARAVYNANSTVSNGVEQCAEQFVEHTARTVR